MVATTTRLYSFLTDDCGVGAYSMATGKAVTYGLVGGLWVASKGSFWV